MNKIVIVRFEGDASIKDEERRIYTNYINECLKDIKDEFLLNSGFIRVDCEKGIMRRVRAESKDERLNKVVDLKLSSSAPFKY